MQMVPVSPKRQMPENNLTAVPAEGESNFVIFDTLYIHLNGQQGKIRRIAGDYQDTPT
jgi:hypothetical protein